MPETFQTVHENPVNVNIPDIIEEEIRHLEQLQQLMQDERDSLDQMDRETLLKIVKNKAAIAVRLEELKSRRQTLETGPDASRDNGQKVSELLKTRDTLVKTLKEENRIQRNVLATQSEQVDRLLGFFRQLRDPSIIYNSNGRLA